MYTWAHGYTFFATPFRSKPAPNLGLPSPAAAPDEPTAAAKPPSSPAKKQEPPVKATAPQPPVSAANKTKKPVASPRRRGPGSSNDDFSGNPATCEIVPGADTAIEITKDKDDDGKPMGLGLSIVGGSDTLLGKDLLSIVCTFFAILAINQGHFYIFQPYLHYRCHIHSRSL